MQEELLGGIGWLLVALAQQLLQLAVETRRLADPPDIPRRVRDDQRQGDGQDDRVAGIHERSLLFVA